MPAIQPQPQPQPSPIGAEIRRVREARGETLQGFAALVGIPWQTLQAYETGRVMPPADRLLRITRMQNRRAPFRFAHVAQLIAA